ncbi:MAG: DUF4287 domain-containing protein, partial [Pseudomonadota bacterium]
ATMLKNLPEKTGKTLKQWFAVLKKTKLEKHGQMVSFLKKDHGVTHGFANLIAHQFRSADAPAAPSGPVDSQYSGSKADLRPIYDAILNALLKFGEDVEVSPKKTYVSLRRGKQFALIQPSTRTRVDVGLNLPKAKPTKRLEPSGSFNAMVSHRVRLESTKDVEKKLINWLKKAYEGAK